jgi:hypothetical protein
VLDYDTGFDCNDECDVLLFSTLSLQLHYIIIMMMVVVWWLVVLDFFLAVEKRAKHTVRSHTHFAQHSGILMKEVRVELSLF